MTALSAHGEAGMGSAQRATLEGAAGLACLLFAVDFLLWGGAFTVGDGSRAFSSEQIRVFYTVPGMLSLGVGLLVLATVARRHPQAVRVRGAIAPVGLAAMAACSLLLGVPVFGGSLPFWALAPCGVFSGSGIACALMAWARLLARFGRADLLRALTFACVAFPVVTLALDLVGGPVSYMAAALLCALAYLGLRLADTALPSGEGGRDGEVRGEATARGLRDELKPWGTALLCLGSLGFVAGVARTSALSALTDSGPIMWGSLACMFVMAAALSVVWHVLHIDVTVVQFYRAGFVVVAASLVAFLAIENDFTATLACFAHLFFEFALVIVLTDSLRPQGGVEVFGVLTGTAYLFLALGTAVGLTLSCAFGGTTPVYGAVVALCIYALSLPVVAIYRRRDVAAPHGHGSATEGRPAAGEVAALYAGRVEELAAAKGLTQREAAVVLLTACGYDAPAIARELVVSDNTVRTHRKNAYRKLGIHSRADLIGLVRTPR